MADTEVKTEEAPVVKAEETTTAANGEAPAAPAATPAVASNSEYAEDESYKKLIELGLKQGVAEACVKLFQSGSMGIEDVDERAVEMLNSLPEDQGKYVINQLRESLMFGVQNKAQYLMSTMRNFRDKVRSLGAATAMSTPLISGPDLDKMKAIMERTGYNLEITVGQRKYGGPPPGWEGPATGPVGTGHEVYIGHIPHDLFEDDLIPLFEQCGKIWDMRLMMDPVTLKNRGYAFLTYCEKESAAEAAKKFDGHEIASGKTLKVNVSVANTRLFLGNIPKSKTKEEILEELKKHADGCVDVILHTVPDATDRHKNRGFCFVDFVDHKAASDAKRKVQQHKIRPFNTDLVVDWAEQQDEPDEETMSKVKVLYVRNLKEAVTEDKLKEIFGSFGEVERIKKIKDYAFVHFKEREPCLKAMEEWNGKELEGVAIDCSLAKPQTDAKKKKHPQQGGGQGRGRGMNYGGGHGGAGGNYGGRGRANNFYPNQGYDDYSGYGGGYGDMGGYGGGYGGHFDPSFGAPNVYGGYGGAGDFGYGAFAASQARGGFRGGFQGGFGGPQQGGWGGPRGGGRGGPMRGGPMRGGPRGGGGFYNNGNRRGGKRPGQSGGGPASKRDNGADYSADVNMSTF